VSNAKNSRGINQILSKYRLTGQTSLSANKFHMAKIQWFLLKDEFKLGIIKRLYFFFHYACHGVKKYFL
jgi:hypothetical protein